MKARTYIDFDYECWVQNIYDPVTENDYMNGIDEGMGTYLNERNPKDENEFVNALVDYYNEFVKTVRKVDLLLLNRYYNINKLHWQGYNESKISDQLSFFTLGFTEQETLIIYNLWLKYKTYKYADQNYKDEDFNAGDPKKWEN